MTRWTFLDLYLIYGIADGTHGSDMEGAKLQNGVRG